MRRIRGPEVLLALALCCSRSTDATSVRHTTVDSSQQGEVAEAQHSTSSSSDVTVTKSDGVIGGWDKMVFGEGAVLEPDGGVVAADGGPAPIASVERHLSATTHVEVRQAASASGTEDEGLDMRYRGSSALRDDEASSKKTETGLLKNPLMWIGAAALAAAGLFALYRFRRKFPFLNFIP